jgi:cytochrome b subunit of formate dehydrogenase
MENNGAGMIRRFSRARVVEHWCHMAGFFFLTVTGLSQRFYYLDISREFIALAGGIDSIRLIHRGMGVLYALILVAHIAAAVAGVVFRKWQPTMLVLRRDFEDAARNMKYYVGLTDSPALCGRYTYKQKFVYWLTLTGSVIMLLTGLVLWFPVAVADIMPGQVIPAAKVMHSSHALLLFLLIALWHMYDSVFSPDVFPLDKSIFTGYITRERMRLEHPLELEEAEGVDISVEKGHAPDD